MCDLINNCPHQDLNGGKMSFCIKKGFASIDVANIIGKSEQTVRRKAVNLGGFKKNNRWFFPICSVIQFLSKETISELEWKEWVILKAKQRVFSHSLLYPDGFKRHLTLLKKKEQIEILKSFNDKIKDIRSRLFDRLDCLTTNELEEIHTLLSSHTLKAYHFKDKDKDYRDLAPVIAGNNVGFTRKEQKDYKVENPFFKTYKYFKNHYRSGVGWRKIRKTFIEGQKYKCEICGSKIDLQVHHCINRANNKKLQLLCKYCHKKHHFS